MLVVATIMSLSLLLDAGLCLCIFFFEVPYQNTHKHPHYFPSDEKRHTEISIRMKQGLPGVEKNNLVKRIAKVRRGSYECCR